LIDIETWSTSTAFCWNQAAGGAFS